VWKFDFFLIAVPRIGKSILTIIVVQFQISALVVSRMMLEYFLVPDCGMGVVEM
jgi:hypothetical protein